MSNTDKDILIEKRAADLQTDDLVDMEATVFPFEYTDPLAEFEFGRVDETEPETPTCLVIHFVNMTSVAVDPEMLVKVKTPAKRRKRAVSC